MHKVREVKAWRTTEIRNLFSSRLNAVLSALGLLYLIKVNQVEQQIRPNTDGPLDLFF